ncbi:tRNA (guanosine(46)-N7)-methyltransferase TrmB [Micromonospora sp. WMMD1102]|uniref:tRNA (guanosine(46)-N7)-methyltransferase TrmB n=1 Tax=Micromonospora sp. WMMD1102 TaxID=3016105 RepID=UPI0024150B9B|nr:tRNA (guanosine(46)-N7)-methyltransferase TrmB [Micromonospora sp. WMMD1102]MDG4788418.1 tRNA (guanosine(46)-N7)-methyltransferase TrmB [Micromonospora sp. WMMD1102]
MPPAGAAEPARSGRLARIRTFHPRRGRLSGRHLDALDRLWPRYGLTVPLPGHPYGGPVETGAAGPSGTAGAPQDPLEPVVAEGPLEPVVAEGPLARGAVLDLAELFGRAAPVVLEIGSGMGDATVTMAAADPGRDYLAVEVHTPGIANLLDLTERQGLTNVRIACGDALDLVRYLLPAERLDAVHVFFPDPWPKPRHHKRRLVQPAHVALLRSRLVRGGVLHCATDWPEYAESMRDTLTADPELVNLFPGFAPRPAHRPVTKFERRGTAAGRPIHDLIFRRR